MTYLAAFVLAAVIDLVWARYTLHMTARHAWRASGWAAAVVGLGGLQVLLYTTHHGALIAIAAGAFAGTWIGIRTHAA